ncbi:MAG: MauE/DoxX family redox-associated membrane protein, partial [Chitinophagaceae bacterium]
YRAVVTLEVKIFSMSFKTNYIVEILSALLICLFIYAAVSKLLNYSLFVAQLNQHPYLKHFARVLALIVPVTEIIIAVLLTIPHSRMIGLYGSFLLLLIFTIYLTLMILSDKHLPCSCGGIISGFSWKEHTVFNLVFIGLAITGIVLGKKQNKDIVATSLPAAGNRTAGV